MAEWQYTTTTAADMLAAFPYQTLPPINGKPTLHTLLQTLKLLCKCSQKIKSGLGPLGYLYVALPAQHYHRFTNVPLVLPGPTPQLPTYPPATDANDRENIKLQWQAHRAENDNIRNMNEALTSLFLATIQPAYKRHLENDLVGVTRQNFWQIFSTFLDKYGRITPIDRELNVSRMKKQWDASEPIETLFAQINDANEYSLFAGTPFQEHDLLQAAEMLVLRTGQFAQEYRDWRALPDAAKTWNHFQDWWQQAYNLREETNITATDLNYSANVVGTTANMVGPQDDENTLAGSLTQFSEAFAANSTVISQLSEANNSMHDTIHNNISNLTNQLETMNNALQHLALNVHRQPEPPQQQQFRSAQQNYQGFQYNTNFQGGRNRGRGGRGGRGGRSRYNQGHGFHSNVFPTPYQQMQPPYQAPVANVPQGQGYQPQQPFPLQQPMQFGQPRRAPPNPYKRFNNWNYCWTHGHDIRDSHTSANCFNPAPGHMWHATKQNTCGGSTRGQHKIMHNSYSYLPFSTKNSNINHTVNDLFSTNDDDEKTIITSNTARSTTNHKTTHGLLDSGATDHFLTIQSKVRNRRPTSNPVTVVIPNGSRCKSTEECDLDWDMLPQRARKGHILPSLKTHALISVVKLCDAGCQVIFKHNCCLVIYNNKVVMYGVRCPRTHLWLVPLTVPPSTKTKKIFTTHHANSIHHMANQRNLIEYLHQCFFSPPASTLAKAIKNDQLLGVPGFTLKAVNKWLPTSTATIKGHLHRNRKNLRSTTINTKKENDDYHRDMNPVEERDAPCELFCYAALAEEFDHTIYSDATGKFPVPSYHGNRYIMVVYVYETNAILVRPMINREKETIVTTFKDIYNYLSKRKFKPKLHVLDNECSNMLKDFIQKDNNTKIQFVEPHQHRVNASERAIQTFKNHFISGLCSAHPQFPLQLWCEFLPQAELTLNLLRKARCNNKLSAYAVLEG